MNDSLMLFFIIALAICALAVIFLGGAYVMAKRCVEVLQGWQSDHNPRPIKPTPRKCHKCNDSGLLIDRASHPYYPKFCNCRENKS